jgi:hypothetical protein
VGNDITEALRNEVARRAHHRCEYCLIVGGATAELLKFNTPERLAERSLLQSLGSYPTKA